MRNRLKVLRAARDWSQADLGAALGVSRQTVNALETGKYDPSLPLAFKIAHLFGLRIEDIFEPDDAPLPSSRLYNPVDGSGALDPEDRTLCP